MKTTYILFLFFISTKIILGQNLVKNPSFEEKDSSFTKKGNPEGVKYWRIEGMLPSNFINENYCAENPDNCYGSNKANSGNSCAVALFFAPFKLTYLQGILEEPLQKGEIYQVEFYYKLADSSNISLREISLALTPKIPSSYESTSSKPWVITDARKITKNNKEWQHFSSRYVAIGGEKIISIGYMGKANNISEIKYDLMDEEYWAKLNITTDYDKRHHRRRAIYYVDDVSVVKTKLIDDLGRISSLYFENNSFILPPSSQKKLDDLLQLKASNLTEYNLVIEGYADQSGGEADNEVLSKKRAQSVADYLIQKGIPTDRIEIKAFGETMAKGIDNTSDRRVDIFLKSTP
ncbi:MAG: hypothetical protein CMO01_04705 [Thalassobius sp.]|nr:hypothetical protein [Thalassovita sp.]